MQGATGAFPAGFSIDEIAITGLPDRRRETGPGLELHDDGITGFH